VFTAGDLYSYRISPQTAAVFDLHARKMEEEIGTQMEEVPRRRISESRSSTDLKRMKALK
jgi:hypothetical protein